MQKRYSMLLLAVVCGLAGLLAGCTGPGELLGQLPTPTPGSAGTRPVAAGDWGGEHIRLTVTDTGATYEMDCAHGDIAGPLAVDGAGRLDWTGTYVQEHGGPIPIRYDTQVQDTHPAHYTGSFDGQMLTVTITLADNAQQIGTYTLKLGQQPRILKCM